MSLTLLAAEVGVNERTLRRAVNLGMLRGVRATSRGLELPLSERRYVRRSWALLSALRAALRTEQNVRLAVLFGSTAAGRDTPASDIDLVVDLGDSSLERVVDLGDKLTAVLGRQVDIVRLEDAETDQLFLADVVAEGRVVVDRAGVWPRLVRREVGLRRRGREHELRRARAALAGIDRLLGS